MIIVDERIGSKHLHKLIPGSHLDHLDSGDVMVFSNTGYYVGIERKTVAEMVSSMQGDKRFTGFQLENMKQDYDCVWLVIDGYHKIASDMMEYLRPTNRKDSRGNMKLHFDKMYVSYSSFRNHLLSIQINQGIQLPPDGLFWNDSQTANFIKLLANWYSCQDSHTSHTGTYDGPTSLLWKPSRKRLVAMQLPGVSHKLSDRVSDHFKSIHQMINAPTEQWQGIDKIGKKKANDIVESIHKEE